MDTNLTQLWLPWKGQPNQIKVNMELYIKHIITNINDENQPEEPIYSTINYYFFGNLTVDVA